MARRSMRVRGLSRLPSPIEVSRRPVLTKHRPETLMVWE
jgi:hypothetical protein